MSALALLARVHHQSNKPDPILTRSPSYTFRTRVLFGTAQPAVTSKDARPEITSKDVHGAVRYTSKRAPAFSLVSRTYMDETRECTKSPGPQRYNQPQIISNLRHPLYPMPPVKGFAGSERQSETVGKTPGPGEYETQLDVFLKRSPSYGFRFKETENMTSALSPDCGSYNVANILRSGKVWRGPSWSVVARPHDRSLATPDKDLIPETDPYRVLIDTCGNKRMCPVPRWSFSKCRRSF